jgi:hypothetical protein
MPRSRGYARHRHRGLVAGEPATIGILADKVSMSAMDGVTVEAAPPVGMKWRSDFITGIARRDGRFVILPDLARFLPNILPSPLTRDRSHPFHTSARRASLMKATIKAKLAATFVLLVACSSLSSASASCG